jgi:hypothetical protein
LCLLFLAGFLKNRYIYQFICSKQKIADAVWFEGHSRNVVLGQELVSCHPSGTYSFEVASRLLKSFGSQYSSMLEMILPTEFMTHSVTLYNSELSLRK